jgi:hypothetical protein
MVRDWLILGSYVPEAVIRTSWRQASPSQAPLGSVIAFLDAENTHQLSTIFLRRRAGRCGSERHTALTYYGTRNPSDRDDSLPVFAEIAVSTAYVLALNGLRLGERGLCIDRRDGERGLSIFRHDRGYLAAPLTVNADRSLPWEACGFH